MKEIPLTRGYVALVDDADYESVAAHKWHAQISGRSVYAIRSVPRQEKRTKIFMHSFIMGIIGIDHADTNGLNNQRYNLRPASKAQNAINSRKREGTSSVYRGVFWNTQRQGWQARTIKNHKITHLGTFRDECDAAQAYNFAALESYGEFARFNVPVSQNAK